MPLARANGLDIFYDEIGDKKAPALLLIMGLGTQMIGWPDAFCGRLADRGFHVIRFDNRDVGLSSKIDSAGDVDLLAAFANAVAGRPIVAPYNLEDMAKDAVGLMDALALDTAHIVGASMGGMIAQIIAAKHGGRARSLTSIMSSSGDPRVEQSTPAAAAVLTRRRPPRDDREASIQFAVDAYRVIGSPAYPAPEADLRAQIARAYDRSKYFAGFPRQLAAVLATGSRVELLKTIRASTLVLHGAEDPLIPVGAGMDTARHIAGATLKIIPGWGHDLPAPLIPALVEAIATHCVQADRGAARAQAAR